MFAPLEILELCSEPIEFEENETEDILSISPFRDDLQDFKDEQVKKDQNESQDIKKRKVPFKRLFDDTKSKPQDSDKKLQLKSDQLENNQIDELFHESREERKVETDYMTYTETRRQDSCSLFYEASQDDELEDIRNKLRLEIQDLNPSKKKKISDLFNDLVDRLG